MGLKVEVDGEVVHEFKHPVREVSVRTAKGEVGTVQIDPYTPVVRIVTRKATEADPIHLEEEERAIRKRDKELRNNRENSQEFVGETSEEETEEETEEENESNTVTTPNSGSDPNNSGGNAPLNLNPPATSAPTPS